MLPSLLASRLRALIAGYSGSYITCWRLGIFKFGGWLLWLSGRRFSIFQWQEGVPLSYQTQEKAKTKSRMSISSHELSYLAVYTYNQSSSTWTAFPLFTDLPKLTRALHTAAAHFPGLGQIWQQPVQHSTTALSKPDRAR